MSDFYKNLDIENQIREHAYTNLLEENCGIVVNDHVIRGMNTHADKRNHFDLDETTFNKLIYAMAVGDRVMTYHTHVTAEEQYFSADDAIMIAETNVPSLLYNHANKKFFYRDPKLVRPYSERPWIPVFNNCYTLVSDWIHREMGIKMDHFQLMETDEWKRQSWNRFIENLPSQGFVIHPKDTPILRGDFILMTIGETYNPNHIAVVIDPSKNLLLHHAQDCPSKFTNYTTAKRKATHSIWRHHSQC